MDGLDVEIYTHSKDEYDHHPYSKVGIEVEDGGSMVDGWWGTSLDRFRGRQI